MWLVREVSTMRDINGHGVEISFLRLCCAEKN
jgi:hypothetical protein